MMNKPLALHEPLFEGNEWEYVKECLDTGWVSSAGKFVDEFEKKISLVVGTKYAVATVNGTSALHIALKVLGVKPGDEVIIPTLTFIAPVNAVIYCGARPIFFDIEKDSLGLCPEAVTLFLKNNTKSGAGGFIYNKQTGNRISACLPVHIFGHPAEMKAIKECCSQYNIPVVEDASESLGSKYYNIPTGSIGSIGCFSFNGNKIITTGGGGMLVSNDQDLMVRAKHLTTQAKTDPLYYHHDQLGYNYRLPNLNAALGCAQLEQLDDIITKKREVFQWYKNLLQDVNNVSLLDEQPNVFCNRWLNNVLVPRDKRDFILQEMRRQNIFVRPAWSLCHNQPYVNGIVASGMINANEIVNRLISLPSSPSLDINEVERAVTSLKELL